MEILPCPDHLSDGAKAEWERMAKLLAQLGLLTAIDGVAFEAYCTLVARWREAEEALKKTGPVVKSPSGYPMLSPVLHGREPIAEPDAGVSDGVRNDAVIAIANFGRSADGVDPMEDFLFG